MGREIRMVPPNYEHPKASSGRYEALLDDFEKAMEDFQKHIFEKGLRDALGYFGGGPSPEEYMLVDYDENDDGCYHGVDKRNLTWIQVFETVTEGTPDTPPFETENELIEYLCTKGSLNHEEYPDICPILSREQAVAFVKAGYVCSAMVIGGEIKIGATALAD